MKMEELHCTRLLTRTTKMWPNASWIEEQILILASRCQGIDSTSFGCYIWQSMLSSSSSLTEDLSLVKPTKVAILHCTGPVQKNGWGKYVSLLKRLI